VHKKINYPNSKQRRGFEILMQHNNTTFGNRDEWRRTLGSMTRKSWENMLELGPPEGKGVNRRCGGEILFNLYEKYGL